MNNIGDKAMLSAAAKRLRQNFPQIELYIITCDPEGIRNVVPGAHPFIIPNRLDWSAFRQLFSGHGWDEVLQTAELDYALRRVSTEATQVLFEKHRSSPEQMGWKDLKDLIARVDFVMVMGGGYFSDAFAYHAHCILETLDEAVRAGKPAFMMGAGFETIQTPALRKAAKAVLPRLELIGVRENITSPGILKEFGVAPERIRFTGDEALIHTRAPVSIPSIGNELGINIRLASYANINANQFERIANALKTVSNSLQTTFCPLPISIYGPSDSEAIGSLLNHLQITSDGGAAISTPDMLASEIRRCRVVITGSYHAAVFAYMQGIPAVMLANSLHYLAKMQGLADQFNGSVIELDDPELETKLVQSIEREWETAFSQRAARLQSLEKLIQANQDAYNELAQIVINGSDNQTEVPNESWPGFVATPDALLSFGEKLEALAEQSKFFEYHATERLKQIHMLTEHIAYLEKK